MGRKPRIEYEGAIYHVIQRGNNREFIFDNDSEKRYLLKKLAFYKEMIGFNLFGYVIMGNHYHLILQTLEAPLNKVMHRVNNSYSKYYNAVFDRCGHVFGDRYKAIPVLDEGYILSLIRYVHQNPVRAQLCAKAGEYRWSSDALYRQNRSGFVEIDFILDLLSPERAKALEIYKKFIELEEESNYSTVDTIGGETFIPEEDNQREAGPRKELDEILLETVASREDYELIKRGSRKQYLAIYKKAYAEESLKYGYTVAQIAQNINLSCAAIYRIFNNFKT